MRKPKLIFKVDRNNRANMKRLSAKERIAEIEKAIAETKQAAEEMEKLNALLKEHQKIVEE